MPRHRHSDYEDPEPPFAGAEEPGFDWKDAILNKRDAKGKARWEWIGSHPGVYTKAGGSEVTFKDTWIGYDCDFYNRANYEYLRKNYPWLMSVNSQVGLDADSEDVQKVDGIEAYLSGVDDDEWQAFATDLDYLENSGVLDEDRASELEMEAQGEWMEDDGVRELQAALSKREGFEDSFLQFAISRIDVSKAFELAQDANWITEGDASWLDMEKVAEGVEPEAVLVDWRGRDIRQRLRRQFDRFKRWAWKHRLKNLFRQELDRHLIEDPEAYAVYQHFSDEQLYQVLLQVTPDERWGSGEPAWYTREESYLERRENRTAREHWTVLMDDASANSEAEAMRVLAMDPATAQTLKHWRRTVAAADPRQMLLHLESAAAVVRVLCEAEESDDFSSLGLDAARYVKMGGIGAFERVYSDETLTIDIPKSSDALFKAIGERVREATNDENFDHYTVYRIPYIVRTAATEEFEPETFWIEEDTYDHQLRVRMPRMELRELTAKLPSIVKGLGAVFAARIKEDPEHYLKMLFFLGGPAAVRPYRRYLRHGSLPGYSFMAGVEYAKRGNTRAAARLLNTENVRVVKGGVWIMFDDWSDTSEMFAKTRNYNWQDNAKQLFNNEAYEWFDTDQEMDLDEARPFMQPQDWETLREVMAGRAYTHPDTGETRYLTRAWLNEWDEDDIWGAIKDYKSDGNEEFEELYDAIQGVLQQAQASANEDATIEGFQSSLQSSSGFTQHKWVRAPKTKNGDRLALFFPWGAIDKAYANWLESDYADDYYDGDLEDLIRRYAEKAEPNADYYGKISAAHMDYLSDRLSELESGSGPPPDPNQPELPLKETGPNSNAARLVEGLITEGYDYSCLMLEVPKEQAAHVQQWGMSHIPEESLYHDPEDGTKGREAETHITVKWGIHLKKPNAVLRDLIGRTKVFPVKLGVIGLFTTNEAFDVVKIEVESPWLSALHARLRGTIPNTETHPSYRPHCTVAYVKKGTCDALAGQEVFVEGAPPSVFYATHLLFKGSGDEGDPQRVVERLPLLRLNELEDEEVSSGQVSESAVLETKAPDPFENLPFPADADRFLRKGRKRWRKRPVCS